MLHSVSPVFNQIRLEEQILFGRDAVAESSRIAHGDLLIPTFLADCPLPLEGESTAHRDGHAGERDSDGGVAGGLVDTHVRRDGERVIGEALRDVDRRALRFLVDCSLASGAGVITVLVIPVVGRGREINTGREGAIGIGLGILCVRPSHLEIFRQAIIGQSFVAQFRH